MCVHACSEARLARLTLFVLLVGLWLACLVPLSRGMASYVEETAGLVNVLPDWADADSRSVVPFLGGQLVTSRRQPVCGILWKDGGFTPLMVDGHLGATSFVPFRWALSLGGLDAARELSIASGVAVLAGVLLLGHSLGSPLGGWMALLLLVTSTQFLICYQWVRPDEQWTWTMPLFAVLALVRHARTPRRGWLVLAGLCIGLAVAAKLTAVVIIASLIVAALEFELVRHLKRLDYLVLAMSALPPLVPQAVWMAFGSHGALNVRFAHLPATRTLLDADRLAFFLHHFIDSFGGLGSYLAAAFLGQSSQPGMIARLSGALMLLGTFACIALLFRKATPRPQRAFGLALGVAVVAYLAIYYQSMSLYLLLAPWIPLAVGLVLAHLWTPGRLVVLRRVAVVGVLVLLCGNGLAQTWVLHRLVARPELDLVARSVHEALAASLIEHHVVQPWTTTHNIVGGLEVATAGRVRPHHAFDLFLDVVSRVGETPAGYDAAWDRVLAEAHRLDLNAGHSDFVLQPAAAKMDVSPLRHRDWLAARFDQAVIRQGGVVSDRRDFRAQPTGPVLLTWATVRWPGEGANGL
jgi:hypothetical protein